MNYKEEIQKNTLRECRVALALRQQDVADMLGIVSTDRISHWEKGTAVPSLVNLFRLCGIYKKLPHELYSALFSKKQSDMEPNH